MGGRIAHPVLPDPLAQCSEAPRGGEQCVLGMCLPSLVLLSIASARPLPPRSGAPLRASWEQLPPPRGAAGSSLYQPERPDNGWCCRGPPHLLPGIPGAAPGPRRPRSVAGDPGSPLLAAAAWLCSYADEPCARRLKAVRRKRRFLCLVLGGRPRLGLSWAGGLQSGPPVPSTSSYVTTTQPHALRCWCHSFSAKIALKNSLGPSSNRSTAGMC